MTDPKIADKLQEASAEKEKVPTFGETGIGPPDPSQPNHPSTVIAKEQAGEADK